MAGQEKRATDRDLARRLAEEIGRLTAGRERPARFMEVCGTHTVAIFRAGLRQILPPLVELVSGPGCPVCVTPDSYIDTALAYAREPDVILTTFSISPKVVRITSGSLA